MRPGYRCIACVSASLTRIELMRNAPDKSGSLMKVLWLLVGGSFSSSLASESSAPPRAEASRQFRRIACLLCVLSAFYCLPLFRNLDNWGRQDWDQFTYRYAVARTALLRDHVLPTWNPYVNGGTVLLAHPDSPVLSPWFAVVMALDAHVGLRVQVVLFMALGTVGMAFLLRQMGATPAGWVVGGIVFMMSSHFALQITEGHLEWCALGLMPWLTALALRFDGGRRSLIFAAFLLASVLTFGAVHIPAVFLPFLSVWVLLEAVRARSLRPIARWTAIVVLSVVLSAVKLLPTLEFASKNPREPTRGGWTTLALLPTMFADPRQVEYYKSRRDIDLPDGHYAKSMTSAQGAPYLRFMDGKKMEWKFHEYACYIGFVGILLALLGLTRTVRQFWPMYGAAAFAGVVVLGATSPVDLWAAAQQLPFYEQFRVPSRFLATIVLVLGIASAFGMSALLNAIRGARARRAVAIGAVIALYGELGTMGWRLFGDIFVAPPLSLSASSEFRQVFPAGAAPMLYRNIMDSNLYAVLLANAGTIDAYENLTIPRGQVRTASEQGYRGEAYLSSGRPGTKIVNWATSRVAVRASASAMDTVVLNQNFYDGWRARVADNQGRTQTSDAIRTTDGLIGALVGTGDSSVVFFYLPVTLLVGACISGAALIMSLVAIGRGSRPT